MRFCSYCHSITLGKIKWDGKYCCKYCVDRFQREKEWEAFKKELEENERQRKLNFPRLTFIDCDGWYANGENGERIRGNYIDLLAEYENTCKTPHQIEDNDVLISHLSGEVSHQKNLKNMYARRRR